MNQLVCQPVSNEISFIDENPGQIITRLEAQIRRPGATAEDYRLLAQAYQKQFEQSNLESDSKRAAQASARAEQLERRQEMKNHTAILGTMFIFLVIGIVIGVVMFMYNGLAKTDERVHERWAQVETVLERRLDLIPPLVETVRGYMSHEQTTLIAVAEARAKTLGILEGTGSTAPKSESTVKELNQVQQDLSHSLKKLIALSEAYPDLKANSSFMTLLDQLEGAENRIAIERQRYNEAVRVYNTKLRVFPSNVVADMFGYTSRGYFESSLEADQPVQVSFKQ